MATRQPMQIGVVGLGRMGADIARRLMRDGHSCVVFDLDPDTVTALEKEGATAASSPADLVGKLAPPRAVWVMLPAGQITGTAIDELASHLAAQDTVIDGGNSSYRDDIRRAADLARRGIHLIDCGTSGGVWGLERGYSLMIGGDADAVEPLRPIFLSISPGIDTKPRTEGRTGQPDPAEHGFLHCGPSGAGHFVKMVHNGIEYGMMASLAEGLNILHHADAGKDNAEGDAETAPMEQPEFYRYELDIAAIAEVWRRGSVVESWLLDLTAAALLRSADLEEFTGRVSDSGEGRWTSIAAIDEGVPAPVLTTALYSRFASRGLDDFAGKALSAMRKGFGGHDEKRQ
ncbi:decarboxylating 6-phosphogluconate dehydrogenase [Catenulispora sp. NF23]|uniref:Decarboxylating 6-phosphogluconate dehydrogenase n=2 Tax=Catenulispora pinistramenti TaxID=2705254 RepID=A0ABS5L187_9ACTN|nr:decarboxylating 6-phosphogluconate dehydrogenase [Catenulispora pinistramenti]MBS2536162.1 decarboxylating 6-phosphogluconate dehydrogenase [Catenulispora pinistramenti]MBS2552093.1 decarboxylating 6-phosphogluconate dehydrogenase [Catenulispora pinistramenti]